MLLQVTQTAGNAIDAMIKATDGRTDTTFLAVAAYVLVVIGLVLATYVMCWHFPRRDRNQNNFLRQLAKDEREERARIIEAHNSTVKQIVESHNAKMEEVGDACHKLHRELDERRREEAAVNRDVMRQLTSQIASVVAAFERSHG